MRLVGWLVPLAVVALAGCAAGDGRGSAADDSFTLPSDAKDGGASTMPSGEVRTIRGVLSFDDIEGGCAFLETADGTRYEVVYPDGWVLDRASGRLHGPEGQDVAPGGTMEIEGTIARDRSSICQVGPIVIATRVEPAAP
jgi:hypothetical protein